MDLSIVKMKKVARAMKYYTIRVKSAFLYKHYLNILVNKN